MRREEGLGKRVNKNEEKTLEVIQIHVATAVSRYLSVEVLSKADQLK